MCIRDRVYDTERGLWHEEDVCSCDMASTGGQLYLWDGQALWAADPSRESDWQLSLIHIWQIFLKVEDEEHPWRYDGTLEVYSAASGNWTALPLDYCRITAAGAQEKFCQWDTCLLYTSRCV